MARRLQEVLKRIPLGLRHAVYSVSFLTVVLAVLPWLGYRMDLHFPCLHVELGWWRLPGGVLFLACMASYLRCSYVLTHRGMGAYVEFDPPKELVTSGPYRHVRNPVAASLLWASFGEVIALSSTGALLIWCCGAGLAHLQVTRLEEPLLEKRFGRQYMRYRESVPRWIPRIVKRRRAR